MLEQLSNWWEVSIGSVNGKVPNHYHEPMMTQFTDAYINGLVQERRNSIANALELRLSWH